MNMRNAEKERKNTEIKQNEANIEKKMSDKEGKE